jgi:hypothetical protein
MGSSGQRRAASPAAPALDRRRGTIMTVSNRLTRRPSALTRRGGSASQRPGALARSRLGALGLAAALAACSGGSDLPNGGIAGGEGTGGSGFGGSTAENVYGGSLSGGSFGSFVLAVLENGALWQFYGRGTPAALDMAGFVEGTGTSNAGTLTSADAKDFGLVPAVAATVTATYTSAPTITGSVAEGVQSISFTGGAVAGSTYLYTSPADLTVLANTWSLHTMTGVSTSVTFDAAGAITATDTVGCTFTGNAKPRASGKNVFDVVIVMGAAPCPAPATTLAGIILAMPQTGGTGTTLLIGAVDSSRSIGFGASGTR